MLDPGYSVFREIVNSNGIIRIELSNMADVLIERRNLETDTHAGRTPGEDETRDKGDVSTSQEMPRFPAKRQKLGEKHGTDFPSQQCCEGINSSDTLTWDFYRLEL